MMISVQEETIGVVFSQCTRSPIIVVAPEIIPARVLKFFEFHGVIGCVIEVRTEFKCFGLLAFTFLRQQFLLRSRITNSFIVVRVSKSIACIDRNWSSVGRGRGLWYAKYTRTIHWLRRSQLSQLLLLLHDHRIRCCHSLSHLGIHRHLRHLGPIASLHHSRHWRRWRLKANES